MRRIYVAAVALSCGSAQVTADGRPAPVVLGAQPYPGLPDGGAGAPLASLWVASRSPDGAYQPLAERDVTVSCGAGCDVVSSRVMAGGPQGVLAVIVDDSGSNSAEPTTCAGCPTDPDGRRIAAVKQLFRSLLGRAPRWRVALFDFGPSTQPTIFRSTSHLAGYSSRLGDLVEGADALSSGGGTYLYDSIADVVPTAAGEKGASFMGAQVPVRVLVVSDGEDTHSSAKLASVLDAGVQLGVAVDAVGYGTVDGGVYPNLAGKSYRDLRSIGTSTGGLVTLVSTVDLVSTFDSLGGAYAAGWVELLVSRPSGAAIDGTVTVSGTSTSFHVE